MAEKKKKWESEDSIKDLSGVAQSPWKYWKKIHIIGMFFASFREQD